MESDFLKVIVGPSGQRLLIVDSFCYYNPGSGRGTKCPDCGSMKLRSVEADGGLGFDLEDTTGVSYGLSTTHCADCGVLLKYAGNYLVLDDN
tara:strand:- start:1198 stop:1473 length:276 start_codon:yes stop_codon:yes gene_type:complete